MGFARFRPGVGVRVGIQEKKASYGKNLAGGELNGLG